VGRYPALSVSRLVFQSVELWEGRWMMSWKVFGRNRMWLNWATIPTFSRGQTPENDEKPQSGYPASVPRFEPSPSRIRIAIHILSLVRCGSMLPAGGYRRLGRTCCLRIQGRRMILPWRQKQLSSSEALLSIYKTAKLGGILLP
jgi:hypothetical protein